MLLRPLVLAACVLSVSAWSPFGGSPAQPAAQPVPEQAADPFRDASYAAPSVAEPAAAPSLATQAADVKPTTAATGVPAGQALRSLALFGMPLASQPYDGTEYRAWGGRIVFRPALFRFEMLASIAIGSMIALTLYGKKANEVRARAYLASIETLLDEQFAQVGAPKTQLLQESPDLYYAYATGRRGIRDGLTAKVQLVPRADVIKRLFDLVYGLWDVMAPQSRDMVTLDAGLSGTNVELAFAVSDKSSIRALRDGRWDLNAFAPVGDHALLTSPSHCVHTETSVVAETMLAPVGKGLGLVEFLASDDKAVKWFESVVVSDLAKHRDPPPPETLIEHGLHHDRRLEMTFKLPPAHRVEEVRSLFTLFLNLVDQLSTGKPALPEGSAGKLKKRRAGIIESLTAEARKDAAEKARESVAERKRKEDAERRKLLSPAAQKKVDELAKRREMRKSQGRTVARK